MSIFSSKKPTPLVGDVTLARAMAALEAARAKATEIEVPQNIAIVDAGTQLVAFIRMDGAWQGSIEIAQDKAYTARAFDQSTKMLQKMSQSGGDLFGIHTTHHGRVVIFPGGIPLKNAQGQVVGGIGVSGGTPDQDDDVAQAGADAFEKALG